MSPSIPFLFPQLSLFILYSTTLTFSLSPPITTANSSISPTKPPSALSPSTFPTPIKPSAPSSSSTLDPKQLRALQSLNIPTSKDPCSPSTPFHNFTTCDSSKPFRHLLSLRLSNCADNVALSITALKSLSTIQDLQFINCPISPIRFPPQLTSNLHSFTCINSLKKLTGVSLSRLQNLTELTVSGVTINASGLSIILGNMKFLHSVTISHTNLSGYLPKHWHLNLTHIDLSGNELKGKIPSSVTSLENLVYLNLSSNSLNGEIPSSIGDLISVKNLSLASNSLSGSIPDSIAAMPGLAHLDLGSNQLNGTIPKFISEMKNLKYLNLEKNNFQGVLPFNGSFIKTLVVFKIGDNANLCYNHSSISSKVKLGIAPCDKHGLPMRPPAAKDSSDDGGANGERSDDDYSIADDNNKEEKHPKQRGPSKIVLGVAIGLSSIVFLIIFLVLLSKWCG